VEEQRFERLGAFTYSFEPDTPAARLPNHLPEDVKESRRETLMAVQQQIAFNWNELQMGRQLDVLIDGPVPGERTAWVGRSYADAPDVDGIVYVTGEGLKSGAIVPCEIVASREYDLVAAACGAAR
jgi:ribosomal protein S12 methylthiotransferase